MLWKNHKLYAAFDTKYLLTFRILIIFCNNQNIWLDCINMGSKVEHWIHIRTRHHCVNTRKFREDDSLMIIRQRWFTMFSYFQYFCTRKRYYQMISQGTSLLKKIDVSSTKDIISNQRRRLFS